MKNTPENKTTFFAQYWGQETLTLGSNDNYPINFNWLQIVWDAKPEYSYLTLRPLSSITDEEAIEVAKILEPSYSKVTWRNIVYSVLNMHFGKVVEIKSDRGEYFNSVDVCLLEKPNEFETVLYYPPTLILTAYQYLQQRGFALPWHGLSVNDLVEYGWIKLI